MSMGTGFIMVLHTFGRDLKWNPHIHCLISEGGYSDNGFWRNVNHFNYTFLRNSFRTALLNEMEHRIGHSFNKVKARCYREHKDGFYVYAKPNKCDPQTVINYIGRYLGRPATATSRIDQYMVTLSRSIITGTKIMTMWKKHFLLWNSLNASSAIFLKSITK